MKTTTSKLTAPQRRRLLAELREIEDDATRIGGHSWILCGLKRQRDDVLRQLYGPKHSDDY